MANERSVPILQEEGHSLKQADKVATLKVNRGFPAVKSSQVLGGGR